MSKLSGHVQNYGSVDINEILRILPHRYPLLLLDRIIEIETDKSIHGIKNVTMNEPQFQGHFPKKPIMPGVMLVEAMAQTAAILVARSDASIDSDGKLVYFMSIDNARFRKPVTPGDTLHIHVLKRHRRGNVWKFDGSCRVDDALVAEASFGAMVAE